MRNVFYPAFKVHPNGTMIRVENMPGVSRVNIYLEDDTVTSRREEADYDSGAFLSDVGELSVTS